MNGVSFSRIAAGRGKGKETDTVSVAAIYKQ